MTIARRTGRIAPGYGGRARDRERAARAANRYHRGMFVSLRSLAPGLVALAMACDARPGPEAAATVGAAATPGASADPPASATNGASAAAMPAGRELDLVRVLAAEVAVLRGQPGLAEMFVREVASAAPWAEVEGWAAVAVPRRGPPVRQVLRLAVDGPLLGFAITPDGSRVAAIGRGGLVRVWKLVGLEATATDLRGASGTFFRVALSPDGSRVAAGGKDGHVWLWSTGGDLIGELRGHVDAVHELAFRPDGQALATAGRDGTVRVWDAATAAPIATIQVAPPRYPDMPADMVSADVSGLAWRPDGQRLATGDHTGVVHEWVVGQAAPALTMRGHTDDILVVRYSRDGARLLSASSDHTVRVWQAATGALERTLTGLPDSVTEAVFSPDGGRVAASSLGGGARVWGLDGDHSAELEGLRYPGGLDFSPDGAYLVVAEEGEVAHLWRGHGAAGLGTLKGHEGRLMGVRFTTAGQIVTADLAGTVRVWRVDRGAPMPGKLAYGRAYSPDGARRFLDERGGEARELEGDRALWSLPLGEVEAAAYSLDGATIGVSTREGEVVLLRARTGEVLRRWKLEMSAARKLAFRPDGALATLSLLEVIVWSPAGERLAALTSSIDDFERPDYEAMAWSPDGAQLALVGHAGDVVLWRVGAAASEPAFSAADALGGHYDRVELLAWSPDGARLAVASSGGAVLEWDVATRRPLGRWYGDPVATEGGLRYSPDGARIEVTDIGLGRYSVPAVRDPADILAALWAVNPTCPAPAERQRWLHLDVDAAARDHARCEAVLRCLAGGTALAACRAPAQP